MAGDSTGRIFKITNWGESHGAGIGVVLEGCPPGLEISDEAIAKDMQRRRPGQSALTTPRKEKDEVKILSGIKNGVSTGTPIAMLIENTDQKSKDYSKLKSVFRPSHADFTYFAKYGIREETGGGRSSARVTAGTVAAGAIARILLAKWFGARVLAYVVQVGEIVANDIPKVITFEQIESNAVRCPDATAAIKMEREIEKARNENDSLGGVVECYIGGVPAGLGEPVYDKLDADLAKAMLGINACKGFELGSGFLGTTQKGSEHNDEFIMKKGKVETRSNKSGGVQGGISNGMPIVFRVAFKPTSTIGKKQQTISTAMEKEVLAAVGRHDPCVLPRAVPIVEASAALVLADHALRHRAQMGSFYDAN